MEERASVLDRPVTPASSVAKSTDAMVPVPDSILQEAQPLSGQACFERGETLWHGSRDVPVNRSEAALWYEQAAAKGLPAGMFAFAESLRWGDGVLRNPGRAEGLYRMAAEAGDQRARRWLAHAYAVGDGVLPDAEKAALWRQQAHLPIRLGWAWGLAGVAAVLALAWWMLR